MEINYFHNGLFSKTRSSLFFQILVSPVLAGLAVGIGVPILLFYVYGVVPVSLCRSGGCGVSTNGSGVRFEFDDENELMGALGGRNVGGKLFADKRLCCFIKNDLRTAVSDCYF